MFNAILLAVRTQIRKVSRIRLKLLVIISIPKQKQSYKGAWRITSRNVRWPTQLRCDAADIILVNLFFGTGCSNASFRVSSSSSYRFCHSSNKLFVQSVTSCYEHDAYLITQFTCGGNQGAQKNHAGEGETTPCFKTGGAYHMRHADREIPESVRRYSEKHSVFTLMTPNIYRLYCNYHY